MDLFLKLIRPCVWMRSYRNAVIKKSFFFFFGRSTVPLISPVRKLSDCHRQCVIYHGPTHYRLISPTFLFPPHSIYLIFHLTKCIGIFPHVAPQASVLIKVESKFQGSTRLKLGQSLRASAKHMFTCSMKSATMIFLSIKDSFQLWVVMIFFKIIITSPKTLAAVGTLTLPNYTANKGSRENVRVKRRPTANPNTLDPPLSNWAGQKPSWSCQRGMRLWNELPTDS